MYIILEARVLSLSPRASSRLSRRRVGINRARDYSLTRSTHAYGAQSKYYGRGVGLTIRDPRVRGIKRREIVPAAHGRNLPRDQGRWPPAGLIANYQFT